MNENKVMMELAHILYGEDGTMTTWSNKYDNAEFMAMSNKCKNIDVVQYAYKSGQHRKVIFSILVLSSFDKYEDMDTFLRACTTYLNQYPYISELMNKVNVILPSKLTVDKEIVAPLTESEAEELFAQSFLVANTGGVA